MNRGTICLGANCEHKAANLAAAAEFLCSQVRIEARSGTFDSEPEYHTPESVYLNEVIEFSTEFDYDTLYKILKEYETEERRRWTGPCVWIDIDIVYWNGECLRPRDAHSSYFLKGIGRLQKLMI